MKIGDLIYSMITLALMILVIASPILRKIFRSAGKNLKGNTAPSEDSLYDSVDSAKVVDRMFSQGEKADKKWDFSRPDSVLPRKISSEVKTPAAMERIDSLPPLKKAVIWSEILGKPVSLRDLE
ncbi:hypothetical protein [Spirochaeta isovalerica]|uniref:Uncharacterized protein n=1 Tax=Spirochaeta isovalerica TaxID=150 RepID=A0A841RF95_9SPIO|nr:hypothetical protein [Spirochaeta isovalerica]MBB6481032.1 hypothetical protein [Spirochaeta isovalerica]